MDTGVPGTAQVSSVMTVHYAELPASPRAARLVDRFWTFATGGRPMDLCPVQQCVPMGMVEIILMVRGSSQGHFNAHWVPFPRLLLVGIMREPVQWTMTGDGLMFGARVRPEAALRLFARPLKELANSHADVSGVLGTVWADGLDRVVQLGDPVRMAEAMEQLLLEQEAACTGSLARFATAMQQLRGPGAAFDRDALAGRLFVGDRQLQRLFKDHLGLSAASYQRIIRFRQAFETATGQEVRRWTDLAYDLGYSDQAHFIRDFKTFCGFTPGMVQEGRVPHFLLRGRLARPTFAA